MKYLIVDLEATNGATNTTPEVIEIGYTTIEKGRICERGGFYVKPHYSSLDPFIERLTGITENDLRYADKFDVVSEKMLEIFPPNEYIFVGWGGYDGQMLNKMFDLWERPRPDFIDRINLKEAHARFYGFKKERGLARALRHAVIEFEGTPHSGRDDAYNTAKLFLDMVAKGWEIK